MTVRAAAGRLISRSEILPRDRQLRGPVLEFLFFLASTSAFQVTRLLVNLVAAAVLLPAAYGTWGLMIVLLTYSQQGSLGIINGANLQIPILLGQGDHRKAAETEEVALAGAIVTGAIVGACAGCAIFALDNSWSSLALPLALAIALQQLYLFYQVSLRARLAFNNASVQQLALAALAPALGLPLLIAAGVSGLVLSQAAAFGVGALLVALAWRRNVRPIWRAGRTLELIVAGFPIMLTGLVYGALVSTDRWVILTISGEQSLGHYTLAATFSSGILFVAAVIAQQFYPRMAHELGRAGATRGLRKLGLQQSILAAAVVLPVAGLFIALSPWAIPTFFPKYRDAVAPLQILSIAYLLLTASGGFTNLLVAVGRAWEVLILQVVAVVVDVVLAVILLQSGAGTAGVALAALVGYSLMLLGAWALAWRATRG